MDRPASIAWASSLHLVDCSALSGLSSSLCASSVVNLPQPLPRTPSGPPRAARPLLCPAPPFPFPFPFQHRAYAHGYARSRNGSIAASVLRRRAIASNASKHGLPVPFALRGVERPGIVTGTSNGALANAGDNSSNAALWHRGGMTMSMPCPPHVAAGNRAAFGGGQVRYDPVCTFAGNGTGNADIDVQAIPTSTQHMRHVRVLFASNS